LRVYTPAPKARSSPSFKNELLPTETSKSTMVEWNILSFQYLDVVGVDL
jgi:hypothetical protein